MQLIKQEGKKKVQSAKPLEKAEERLLIVVVLSNWSQLRLSLFEFPSGGAALRCVSHRTK